MSEPKYFNFPIFLLKGFLINTESALSAIINYALYAHSLKLEDGDDLHKIKSSAEYFSVTISDPKYTLAEGKKLFSLDFGRSPKVGINTEMYWDYRNNYKIEFQKVCLLGHLALRSILQKKPYCKIDNKFWLARMDGKAKSCEFDELSPQIKKYANEYQTKKIKGALSDKWNLTTYSRHTRGFYVSYSLSIDELVFQAEKKRQSNLDKRRKEEINQAIIKAKKRLNGGK
jgi:hypothetical protein